MTAPTSVPQHRVSRGYRVPREAPAGLAWPLLLTLWVLMNFGPQWWIEAHGFRPVLKLQLLMFVALVTLLLVQVPTRRAWTRRWRWYVPLLAFIATGVVTMPFAVNYGMVKDAMTQMTLYWVLIVATVVVIDGPRRAEKLLLLYGLQFLWWGVWGAQAGRIVWHPTWANYDGYGAMMVGGIGISWFFFLASPKGWFRRAMFVTMGLCAIGIVASFARGAFLGAAGLFAVIWYRSPHRGRTLGLGVGAALLMVVSAAVLHPGTFWTEIRSTFTEGTTEGTGEDRWVLWAAGVKVFASHPLLGVGPSNFGPFAAHHFRPGEVGGLYADNPGRLYNRELHSMWVQFLAERGLVGMALFCWILLDFWRRNAYLRRRDVGLAWRAWGGRVELRDIALGLEASMVAYLVVSAFYALVATPWLYTLLALNLMLHGLASQGRALVARPYAAAPPGAVTHPPGAVAAPARPAPGTPGAPPR